MKWKSAKDLMVGEMFTTNMDEHLLHCYREVVGHEHEKELVKVRSADVDEEDNYIYTHLSVGCNEDLIPYNQRVLVRPEAPTCARKKFREQCNRYKFWPYDKDGNFSFTKLDWRFGTPE